MEAANDVSTFATANFPVLPDLLPPCFGSHRRVSRLTRLKLQKSFLDLDQGAGACRLQENPMLDNYIIEVRPPVSGVTFPAGIVVRDGRSFRFFAASHVFSALEGRRFDSPRTAERAALRRIADVTSP
jgi:hypothetical protein